MGYEPPAGEESGPTREWPIEDGLPAPGTSLGDYVVLDLLGTGGMGAVFRARQNVLQRDVALKLMLRRDLKGPEKPLERFLREATCIAALNHENIVRVHTAGMIGEVAFIDMELVKGRSLRAALTAGPLGEKIALSYVLDACQALGHAHAHGIIHRDVKPANLLLTENGRIKVADFGISYSMEQAKRLTATGRILGTAAYMAPEQCRGLEPDPRTDLYALGVLLYELLSGSPPFQGNLGELIFQHLNVPPPELDCERLAIRPRTAALVLRLLAKDPANRYPSAESLNWSLSRLLGRHPGVTLGTGTIHPYRGLKAFEGEHAPFFFGRDPLISTCVARLASMSQEGRVDGRRLLAILGPSGSGKSSLIHAGLVPRLLSGGSTSNDADTKTKEADTVSSPRDGLSPPASRQSPVPQVVSMTPTAHPLGELALGLARCLTGERAPIEKGEELRRVFCAGLDAAGEPDRGALRLVVRALVEQRGAPLLLVIDQLEELYTLCHDVSVRRHFVAMILEATQEPAGHLTVVCGLRTDFIGHTQETPALNQWISMEGILVPSLDEAGLRDVIVRPAELAGQPFDQATVDRLIDQTMGRDGALPLLQFTLRRIWDGMERGIESGQTLRSLGGVGGALAGAAEEIYTALEATEREVAKRAFIGLVQLDHDGNPSRARPLLDQLCGPKDAPRDLRDVLRRFAQPGARLVTLSADAEGRERFEVAHEALFEHWSRLTGWIEENRGDLRLLRQLTTAAGEWAAAGYPDGMLWRQPRLGLIQVWRSRQGHKLDDESTAFSDASAELERHELEAAETQRAAELESQRRLAQAEREAGEESARRLRSARRSLAALSALIVTVIGLAIWAVAARSQALQAEAAAVQSEQEARAAEGRANIRLELNQIARQRGINATKALGLALNAYHTVEPLEDPPLQREVASTLFETLQNIHEVRRLRCEGYIGQLVGWSVDLMVNAASPDNAVVVCPHRDGRIFLRSLTEEAGEATLLEGTDAIEGGVESRLVGIAAFNPTGDLVSAVNADGRVGIWRRNGAAVFATNRYRDQTNDVISDVETIRWSPDGHRLAIGTETAEVAIWSRGTNALTAIKVLGEVRDLEWLTDDRIVIGLENGELLDWTLNTPPRPIGSVGSQLLALELSPDRSGLLAISAAGEARLHDVHDLPRWRRIDHTLRVIESGALGPSGEVALCGPSGNLQLFSPSGVQQVATKIEMEKCRLVWSPNGERLLAHGTSKHPLVISKTGEVERSLIGHDAGTALCGVWLGDNNLLTIKQGDEIIQWQMAARAVKEFRSSAGMRIVDADWSPDGRYVFAAEDAGEVWVVDLETRQTIWMKEHSRFILDGEWHPSKRLLATAAYDQTAKVWDLETDTVATLRHEAETVYAVAWNPNGDRLLTSEVGDGPSAAYIWSLESLIDGNAEPKPLKVLRGHEQGIRRVEWSPDGRSVATASDDGTARVWDAESGTVTFVLPHSPGVNVNDVTWLADGSYLMTCGEDATVKIWDRQGHLSDTFTGHEASIREFAWSRDKQVVVTHGLEGQFARLHIDPASGSFTRGELLQTSQTWLWEAAWGPGDEILAVGDATGMLSLIDRDLTILASFNAGGSSPLRALSWNPVGNEFLTAGSDGRLRIWPGSPALAAQLAADLVSAPQANEPTP